MAEALTDDGGGPEAAMIRGAETLAERSKRTFVKPNNIVHLFSWGGDLDRAMEWLERSRKMRDHEVAYMGSLGPAPRFRADARFQAFLRNVGLPTGEGAAS